MKLSEMITAYIKNIGLKAKLKKQIKIVHSDGSKEIIRKGTVSQLLIETSPGVYHFEVGQKACTVSADEIELISENNDHTYPTPRTFAIANKMVDDSIKDYILRKPITSTRT